MASRRRAAIAGVALLAATCCRTAGADTQPPTVARELPVTATNADNELANNSPALAVDPTDNRFVALASRIDAPEFGCTLHLSGDGGRTWLPSQVMDELPPGADRCYAPEIAFDRKGALYFLFVGLQGPGNVPMGAFLSVMAERGQFSPPRQVLGPTRFMVRMVIDGSAGGRGRLHLVWLEARAAPPLGGLPAVHNPILAAYSDDGGGTFSEPVEVADPARKLVVAPAVTVGKDGAVHVAYYDLEDDRRDYQGLEGPAWDGTWSIAVATSTDRGRTFSVKGTAATGLLPPERVMLIFTMPPPAIVADGKGGVWVSWWDATHGDWDVFVARSSDGARSFLTPERVNDDPVGNGRHQYLPRLSLGAGGRLDVIFYDRRGDEGNVNNDVSYAFSLDGGRHFSVNRRVTRESSHTRTGPRYAVPSAIGMIDFGSRLALVPTDTGVLAAWTDTRNVRFGNTHQDIFATEITVSAGENRSTPIAPIGAALLATALVVFVAAVVARARRRRPLAA